MAPTILYAEDEEDDAWFLAVALARVAPDARLAVVRDGRDAVAYLAGEGRYADRDAHPLPGLLLLDFNLPFRSGLEVARWARGRPAFDETPVVMFSSSGRDVDREVARLMGADHYLVKPMDGDFEPIARELMERWVARG